MNAKINNFINLGIGNAGDGGESLPVYGIAWEEGGILVVFKSDNIVNIINILSNQRSGGYLSENLFTNVDVLFYGELANGYNYTDFNKNITISNPKLETINMASDNLIEDNTITIEEGSDTYTNILEALNIEKGFYLAYYNNPSILMFAYFDSSSEFGYTGNGVAYSEE